MSYRFIISQYKRIYILHFLYLLANYLIRLQQGICWRKELSIHFTLENFIIIHKSEPHLHSSWVWHYNLFHGANVTTWFNHRFFWILCDAFSLLPGEPKSSTLFCNICWEWSSLFLHSWRVFELLFALHWEWARLGSFAVANFSFRFTDVFAITKTKVKSLFRFCFVYFSYYG